MKLTVGQFILLLIIIIAVAAGAFFGTAKMRDNDGATGKERQAIFLTNGQVYFGEISGTNSKWITVKDIYYLQVQQPIQPAKEGEQPQISLVKLGNELHGPKDEMKINRDHILFYEDMKDDAKVNQAIADFIKNGGANASPAPAASPAQ